MHLFKLVQNRFCELATFFEIPRDLIEIFFELVDVSQLLNDISFVVNDDREFFDRSVEKNAAAKLGYGWQMLYKTSKNAINCNFDAILSWGMHMKSTGIVRRINELGRIVLPIEMRRTLGVREKDPVEIFTEADSIILRKYQAACVFCNSTKQILHFQGKNICFDCFHNLKAY